MVESVLAVDIGLHLLRFLFGSTILLSAALLLERWQWAQNFRFCAEAWKLAIFCSLLLLLPINIPFTPTYYFERVEDNSHADTRLENSAAAARRVISPSASNVLIQSRAELGSSKTLNMSSNNDYAHSQFSGPINLILQLIQQAPHANWIVSIWASISLIFLIRQLSGFVCQMRQLGRRHLLATTDRRHEALVLLRQDMDIDVTLKLTESSQIASPVVLIGNEICFPKWTSDLSQDELLSLLAHELSHIKERDLQTLFGLHLLTSLFFFQPLFFVAKHRLQNISEFLADATAKNQCGSTAVANALINCAEKVQSHKPYRWGFAMVGDTSRLKARIEKLLQENAAQNSITRSVCRGAAFSFICVSFLLAPSFKYEIATEKLSGETSMSAETDRIENPNSLNPTEMGLAAESLEASVELQAHQGTHDDKLLQASVELTAVASVKLKAAAPVIYPELKSSKTEFFIGEIQDTLREDQGQHPIEKSVTLARSSTQGLTEDAENAAAPERSDDVERSYEMEKPGNGISQYVPVSTGIEQRLLGLNDSTVDSKADESKAAIRFAQLFAPTYEGSEPNSENSIEQETNNSAEVQVIGGGEIFYIEDFSRSELRAEIKKIQREYYRVHNANVKKDDFKFFCGDFLPTGTHIKRHYCEPGFQHKLRSASLFDFPKARRSGYEELANVMNSLLQENRYFRELHYLLQVLKERQQELAWG
ncbi:MAG: hypothetical protein COB20_13920 [SAR86 cluster bacterium]|uniref:Peptidase M56 domain-containing protein n=1 Tax=SAR86 cluster bacterium TaxID=2030880 RepID=A0A2A4WXB3_9GAMM|nr:MAG: hypothetical protein COB20_13920 [SAR86 cluster bacterium]